MASPIAAFLFIVTICLGYTTAFSEHPVDCCLEITDRRFPRGFTVVSYHLQTIEEGCDTNATVFEMKMGARLCAPHPTERKWVADIIKRLERSKQDS